MDREDEIIINNDDQSQEDKSVTIHNELAEKFKDDPLSHLLIEAGKSDLLLPDAIIDQLKRKNLYSISQAADIVGKKDYNIRNNIQRNGLGDYVGITQTGKLYRLDYIGIYKLYLIFTVQEELRLNPADIASVVGVMAEKVRSFQPAKPNNFYSNNEIATSGPGPYQSNQDAENQILRMIMFNQLVDQRKEKQYELVEAKRLVSEWEIEMNHLNQMIEMQESLRAMAKNVNSKEEVNDWITHINKSLKNAFDSQQDEKGFWGRLFGSKKEDNSFKEVELSHKESAVMLEIEQDLDKLKKQKEEILGRKELLLQNRSDKENELKAFDEFVESQRTLLIDSTNNPIIRGMLENNNPAALLSHLNEKDQ